MEKDVLMIIDEGRYANSEYLRPIMLVGFTHSVSAMQIGTMSSM